MKKYSIKDMTKGWFVGDFLPVAFQTKDCEIAYKEYQKGDSEEKHVHKIATELTLITKGRVMMNGVEYGEGEIILLEPGDATDFKALTDVANVVVKVPSVKGDKYLINEFITLTHRGLEPSNQDFYPESSYESFRSHLNRGFGIEFDPCFAKDCIVVCHDSSLDSITMGENEKEFQDLTWQEIKQVRYGSKKARIALLSEVFDLIRNNNSKINAMHLKGKYQTKEYLDRLINGLLQYREIISKLIIFDVKPDAARYIKEKIPEISIAPSVAHTYDIKRYNECVLGTLISREDAIRYKQQGLYDWVWLDEWDLSDEEGNKKFYTKETFDALRQEGYKIALVTPELHRTSPGLLGGEAHPDSVDREILFSRIKEILELRPDAICTDYPEEISNL